MTIGERLEYTFNPLPKKQLLVILFVIKLISGINSSILDVSWVLNSHLVSLWFSTQCKSTMQTLLINYAAEILFALFLNTSKMFTKASQKSVIPC